MRKNPNGDKEQQGDKLRSLIRQATNTGHYSGHRSDHSILVKRRKKMVGKHLAEIISRTKGGINKSQSLRISRKSWLTHKRGQEKAIVIMDKEVYNEAVTNQLNNGNLRELRKEEDLVPA